jgi:hypothetical protein
VTAVSPSPLAELSRIAEELALTAPERRARATETMFSLTEAFRGLSRALLQATASMSCLSAVPQDSPDVLGDSGVLLTAEGQDTGDRGHWVSFFDGRRWTGQCPRRYVPQGHP